MARRDRFWKRRVPGSQLSQRTPANWLQAILKLAADGAERATFGANARQHIVERYSREQSAKKYVECVDGKYWRKSRSGCPGPASRLGVYRVNSHGGRQG